MRRGPGEGGREIVGQFALLADRLEDRLSPRIELAQVGEPLGKRPQLHVVEPAGRVLPIARDEGHGGAAIQKLGRLAHLGRSRPDLGGNGARDAFSGHVHAGSLRCGAAA